jgi:hypothetical protein
MMRDCGCRGLGGRRGELLGKGGRPCLILRHRGGGSRFGGWVRVLGIQRLWLMDFELWFQVSRVERFEG